MPQYPESGQTPVENELGRQALLLLSQIDEQIHAFINERENIRAASQIIMYLQNNLMHITPEQLTATDSFAREAVIQTGSHSDRPTFEIEFPDSVDASIQAKISDSILEFFNLLRGLPEVQQKKIRQTAHEILKNLKNYAAVRMAKLEALTPEDFLKPAT